MKKKLTNFNLNDKSGENKKTLEVPTEKIDDITENSCLI